MNKRGLACGVIALSTALAVACGSDSDSDTGKKNTGGTGGNTGGSGGGNTGGSNTGGSNTGGSSTGGTGGNTGGSAGTATGGSAGAGGSAGTASGGSAGSSVGGAGGSGGKPDGGTKSCAELSAEYAAALEAAKACNPVLSVVQCTKAVGDELACPCPTYINPGNTKAAAELDALQADWNAQNCGSGVICPAVLCPAPTSGICQAQGGSLAGKCADSNVN